MRLFVTGASGFVGTSLIADLVKEQHIVYGLVRGHESARVVSDLGAIPVRGDLLAVQDFKKKLEGIDTLIHLGAKIKFVGDLDEFYDINVVATRELLEATIGAGVKKFIYVSAAAIAMDGNPLIDITEEYQADEMIASNYLRSKVLAEQEILKRKAKIQTIILRPPVIWGPGMRIMEEFRSTIKLMGFPTIGAPDHHLATCHVKNLNAAILLSLANEQAEGVFLVSDDEKVEVSKIMRELIKGYGMDMGNLRIPKSLALVMAGFLEFIWKVFKIKGSPPMTTFIVQLMGTEFTIDDTKARKQLGYIPVISVEEGLSQLKN